MRVPAVVALVWLMGTGGAAAATRYVSPAGDDSGPGAASRPWRTLAHATASLRPGDRLVVRPGRYAETLNAPVSGAPGRPIVIQGEGRPQIVGGEEGMIVSGAWLELRGLDARATGGGSALRIAPGAHHVVIADDWLHDSACAGVGAVGTDHLLIENNRVWGNGRRAPWQCSGISIYQPIASDDAPGFHNVIRGNTSYDNMDVVVVEAVSHSQGHTTDGNGIILDDFENTQGGGRHTPYRYPSLVIGNTVFDNGGRGVHVFKSRNVAIVGNVAWHDLKDANLQRPAGEISVFMSAGTTVVDNIAVPRAGDAALTDAYATGTNVWDYNFAGGPLPWSAIRSGARRGPNLTTGRDPGFVRASSDPSTADFRLRTGAAAKGTGVAVRLGGPALVRTRARSGGAAPPAL